MVAMPIVASAVAQTRASRAWVCPCFLASRNRSATESDSSFVTGSTVSLDMVHAEAARFIFGWMTSTDVIALVMTGASSLKAFSTR